MKKFIAAVLFIVSVPALAGEINDIQIIKGKCTKQSHVAEGPIGGDLTKRQSRFFCDSAVLSFFDEASQHVMITFSESQSHTGKTVGFAGMMDDDGQIMSVHDVYLGQDKYPVQKGYCKFFFEKTNIKSIACGAPIDQGRRRTVPVVIFEASNKQ